MRLYYVLLACFVLGHTNCQPAKPQVVKKTIDIQGHRGCRGLMPENTLPAFQKALELDVTTLELDLAVSQDKQLVVSHEPYFRAGLSIAPDGTPITKEDELNHNIYQMPYETVKLYDVGSLPDESHPEQEKIRTFKPLLRDVVNKANQYAHTMQKPRVKYNIEIKRSPEYDGEFHPPVAEFVDLVLSAVNELDIFDQTTIQSFDAEALRLVKAKAPRIKTAWLIMNQKTVQENITDLGFKPEIYSCYFKLLNEADVAYLQENEILVIPWTVNEREDIQSMIGLGVDGIISDYPDRVIDIVYN